MTAPPRPLSLLLFTLLSLCSHHAWAQSHLRIGSPNAATAEPPVSRPSTQPIPVPLFHDLTFTDYASQPFSYVPPAGSAKRWAKIVLVADFYVTAGRQFDRTGEMSIGHTNVYFGTTAEPSDHVSPAWHVERDLTDDTALFRVAQPGQVQIGNTVDSKYTGVIHGTATLLFYPLARHEAPPTVPDLVLPLPAGKNGEASVSSPSDTLTQSYTFSTNTVRVYLDLMTQSQGSDEFWYLSVPGKTQQDSSGTAFREVEITVDGAPAGVAPVFPWIYTGGIDPGWWRPIPAVQTLDFAPYRVDLTPFAGQFSNGKPHTIGVRVFGNANFFQIAGVLRVYRDPKIKIVRGGLLQDTLTANPAPIVQNHLTGASDAPLGSIAVTSSRRFTVAGYVLTSAGKVKTTITQTISFSSAQEYTAEAHSLPAVRQLSTAASVTQIQTPGSLMVQKDTFQYPLTFASRRRTNPDGSMARSTSVEQGSIVSRETRRDGKLIASSRVSDLVHPSDTQRFDAAGKPQKREQHSSQTYTYADLHGGYTKTLTADNGVLTSIQDSRPPNQ